MASSNALLLLSCLILSFMVSIFVGAKPSFRPKNVVLWVTKDSSSLQYVTHITQRTPMVPVKVTLDLGTQFLWVDCEQGYKSSSYKSACCGFAQCSLAKADSCNGVNTCGLTPDNTITRTATSGDLGEDVLSIQSTDGSNPRNIISVPKFLFTCSATFLLQGLASGAKGMAGLGRTQCFKNWPLRYGNGRFVPVALGTDPVTPLILCKNGNHAELVRNLTITAVTHDTVASRCRRHV